MIITDYSEGGKNMPKLFCRYSKLVRPDELPSWFKITSKESLPAEDSNCGKSTYEFYKKLRIALEINVQGNKSTVLIYPLRIAEIYVCSRNGKSKLFDSNIKMYHHLQKIGAIQESSDAVRQEFQPYKMLDFEKIASLIPGATAIHQPLYQYQLDDEDVVVKNLNKAQIWAIPCLFEDLVYFEVFIERKFVDDDFKSQAKAKKLIEIKDEAFMPPTEVFTELLEHLSEYNF